jgi:hypothetical protein
MVPFRVFRLFAFEIGVSTINYNNTGGSMSRKSFIMIGMVIGSIAGGYAPILLGADSISASLIGSSIGGFLGIWGAFKLYG